MFLQIDILTSLVIVNRDDLFQLILGNLKIKLGNLKRCRGKTYDIEYRKSYV